MKKQIMALLLSGSGAMLLILFSPMAKQGAENGLILSQHTIIPSLLPLLIMFMIIMKSDAKDIIARLFGRPIHFLFNLPYITAPAIILGLAGGYPTGALLTLELYENDEISKAQAKRLMSFNFCGGCGFIITAVGTAHLGSQVAGLILFASNVLSSVIIGIALSLREKRCKDSFYSFTEHSSAVDIINSATSSAVSSVLNITAIIMLFSALMSVVKINDYIMPLFEITAGVCGDKSFPLPLLSAYLSFGSFCIHLQLLGALQKIGMSYFDFLAKRALSAILSCGITRLMLVALPQSETVFSNVTPKLSLTSTNYTLSFLLVIGSVVLILDLRARKIRI